MWEALRNGRTDLVLGHVQRGGSATETDPNGVPLSRWCAYFGDVSALVFLLEHGAELASLGENFDLNGAAFHGHWRLCQFLLEQGADPNHCLADTAETALHAALCRTPRYAAECVVAVLLDAGADPGAVTRAGVETGAFMRDARTRGETPLHRAAAFGTEGAIERLLAAGAQREVRDAHGDSPLAWASWHGRPAHVLERLCFGEQRVHPHAVEESRARHGPETALERYLIGSPLNPHRTAARS